MTDIYPLTIVKDRYTGTYSGGIFTAWNIEADEVPTDIYGDDTECRNFWSDALVVGRGDTAEEAEEDLERRIAESNGDSKYVDESAYWIAQIQEGRKGRD